MTPTGGLGKQWQRITRALWCRPRPCARAASTCSWPGPGTWDLEHFLFGTIESAPGVNAFFSLGRTAQEDPFLPGDKALIRQVLLGHLQRSVALHRSLDAARGENALLSGVLDLARYGIVLFDQRGRPIRRNRAADALLATGDGLEAAQQATRGWSVAPPAPVLVGRRGSPSPCQVTFSPLRLRGDRSGLPSGSAVLAVIQAGRHGNAPALPPELRAT